MPGQVCSVVCLLSNSGGHVISVSADALLIPVDTCRGHCFYENVAQRGLINQTERGWSVNEMVIELSDTEMETEESKLLLPSM